MGRYNAPKRQFTGVYLDGMDDFRSKLRTYGRTCPRLLADANRQVSQLGVEKARALAESQGSTAKHVAPSLRAGSRADYAYVALGNATYDMALGAEFGAKKYPQFKPWVGNQWEKGEGPEGGYFLGPAMRAALPEMLTLYERLFDQIERTVFNERPR